MIKYFYILHIMLISYSTIDSIFMLHTISLWLIYFTGDFIPLISFTYFDHHIPFGNYYFVLCICVFLSAFFIFICLLFVLDSIYKWKHTMFVFSCSWSISLVLILVPSLLSQVERFHYFLKLINLLLHSWHEQHGFELYESIYFFLFFFLVINTRVPQNLWLV